MEQLKWLNGLARTDPGLVIVPSHDEDERLALIRQGALGDRLE